MELGWTIVIAGRHRQIEYVIGPSCEVIKMAWEDIVVNSKIVGHISAGIYRSAGGALKELVSNAFDADATRIVITTNRPSFDVVTCYDNGGGLTLAEFRRVMRGGIGESAKRLGIGITPLGRPIIGMLGIGMLGIAQVCHTFKVTSHHRQTGTAFQATIRLMDYLREEVDDVDPKRASDEELEVGKFEVEEIEYDSSQAGTYIVASDMRTAFVNKFRESTGDQPLPLKFSSFLKTIHRGRSIKELGDYWQMVWELAVACPIPYVDCGPFRWDVVGGPSRFQEEFKRKAQALQDFQFEVVVDGLSLRKPCLFPYPLVRRDKEKMTGRVFLVDKTVHVHGRSLKLSGYIYMQDGQAIKPIELRGLLIRIRDVAIGAYDPTFLKYPNIEGPRFNWLSGEIYVEEGLEHALNIDRDSFNEMHPHFVALQRTIHNLLQEVFQVAGRGVTERSRVRRQREESQRRTALEELLAEELGDDYELAEIKEKGQPLVIDTNERKVLISTESPLWPKARSKRELARLAAVAFEASMLVPESERRERFYKLLSRVLNL